MRERKINRMKGYDYKTPGYYYVTICTKDRKEWFGKIIERKMVLNDIGRLAQKYWIEIRKHNPQITIDEYIVMPNHIHGILILTHQDNVGDADLRPLQKRQNMLLSTVIHGFKSSITRELKRKNIEFSWQRSFYDHIIRTEHSLKKIREYIRWNPLKWDIDPENKEVIVSR